MVKGSAPPSSITAIKTIETITPQIWEKCISEIPGKDSYLVSIDGVAEL